MKHRGKHPNDDKDFAAKWHPIFVEASHDLSFLLGRNYGEKSALALVGNRYQLNSRQQRALSLITAPSDKILARKNKQLSPKELEGKSILIDGYNLLILLEVALSGGFVFKCQDGTCRDIASIHGTYKKVEETLPALILVDTVLKELNVKHAHWYFDSPVSNSGRLKTLLYELATEQDSKWDIDLVFNPDMTLVEQNGICVTGDSWIIDEVDHWVDLAGYIITTKIKNTQLLDFFL